MSQPIAPDAQPKTVIGRDDLRGRVQELAARFNVLRAADAPASSTHEAARRPVTPERVRAALDSALAGRDQAEEEHKENRPPVLKIAYKYVCTGPENLVLYRADGRAPAAVKPGFRSRDATTAAAELALFLPDPAAYARSHVSTNNSRLISTALDQECGGFASNDRYVYQINVTGWHRFVQDPPALSSIRAWPDIHADSASLDSATAAVIGPMPSTREMDFFGEIPPAFVTAYRKPSEAEFRSMSG